MPIRVQYKPPAVSALPLISAAADIGVKEAAEHLLTVSEDRCPKDTGRLRDSGEVTDYAGVEAGPPGVHAAAVSYGREDGDGQNADTADYCVVQHENLAFYHPIGQAKWLEVSMHSEAAAMAGLMAEPLRAVLR